MLKVEQFILGIWKENAYILHNDEVALIIDPGENAPDIINKIETLGIKPLAILCTHAHFDHVGAVYELKETYKIPFYLHSKDKRLLRQANLYRKFAGDNNIYRTPSIDYFLDDMKDLKIKDFNIKVIYTPGHSKGSVSFLIDELIFSGDILFEDNIGRTDLPGGNKVSLQTTLKLLFKNYTSYKFLPGHGNAFVLANLLESNFKLKSFLDDTN